MSNASVLILLRVVTLAKFKGLSAPSQEVLNPLNLRFTPQKYFLSSKWMDMIPQPRFKSIDNDLINFLFFKALVPSPLPKRKSPAQPRQPWMHFLTHLGISKVTAQGSLKHPGHPFASVIEAESAFP